MEAEGQADLFFIISVYFSENFKDLFKEHPDPLAEYMALLTLNVVIENNIAEENIYLEEDSESLSLSMVEGLHEEIVEGISELALLRERTEDDENIH